MQKHSRSTTTSIRIFSSTDSFCAHYRLNHELLASRNPENVGDLGTLIDHKDTKEVCRYSFTLPCRQLLYPLERTLVASWL